MDDTLSLTLLPPSPTEKVARLKQAKAEAEAEIAQYKADREAQFSVFSKEVLTVPCCTPVSLSGPLCKPFSQPSQYDCPAANG